MPVTNFKNLTPNHPKPKFSLPSPPRGSQFRHHRRAPVRLVCTKQLQSWSTPDGDLPLPTTQVHSALRWKSRGDLLNLGWTNCSHHFTSRTEAATLSPCLPTPRHRIAPHLLLCPPACLPRCSLVSGTGTHQETPSYYHFDWKKRHWRQMSWIILKNIQF